MITYTWHKHAVQQKQSLVNDTIIRRAYVR